MYRHTRAIALVHTHARLLVRYRSYTEHTYSYDTIRTVQFGENASICIPFGKVQWWVCSNLYIALSTWYCTHKCNRREFIALKKRLNTCTHTPMKIKFARIWLTCMSECKNVWTAHFCTHAPTSPTPMIKTTTTTVKYSEKSDFIELSMRVYAFVIYFAISSLVLLMLAVMVLVAIVVLVLLLFFALIERIFSHSQITH